MIDYWTKLKDVFDREVDMVTILKNEASAYTWKALIDTPLQKELYYNFGNRPLSPLIESVIEDDKAETITESIWELVLGMIVYMYGDNWERIYKAITADYDPIENYSMSETETGDRENTVTREDNTTNNGTTTNKTTNSTSSTSTGKAEVVDHSENNLQIYGFNSTSFHPSNTNDADTSSDTTTNNTTEMSGSINENGTITNTINTQGNETGNETHNRTLKRSGNIGVTTSQQMIESEIELRKYRLRYEIMHSIGSYLTTDVYI